MPDDAVFCQLVASMTTALGSQEKASFSARQPFCNSLGVSPSCCISQDLPMRLKHVLLSIPSSSFLFDQEVICSSLTQVKDDSQLSLLKNLSSLKDGKQLASTASTSGHRRRDSLSSSSSFC